MNENKTKSTVTMMSKISMMMQFMCSDQCKKVFEDTWLDNLDFIMVCV